MQVQLAYRASTTPAYVVVMPHETSESTTVESVFIVVRPAEVAAAPPRRDEPHASGCTFSTGERVCLCVAAAIFVVCAAGGATSLLLDWDV